MAAVLNAEPTPLRIVRPDIPHEFEEIVEKALIKTRAKRV